MGIDIHKLVTVQGQANKLSLNFNFALGDLATLLLGMLGDMTRQSSHGKFG
jgi:hypothetical protein